MVVFRLVLFGTSLFIALPGLFAKTGANETNFMEIILPYAALLSIMLTIIIAVSVWYVQRKKTRIKRLKRKAEEIDMKLEKLQKDYFVHKRMPKSVFEKKYAEHKELLIKIFDKMQKIKLKRKDRYRKESVKAN